MDLDNCSDRDGASTIFEETDSVSVREVMKSPVFSEDESSGNSFWDRFGSKPIWFGSFGTVEWRWEVGLSVASIMVHWEKESEEGVTKSADQGVKEPIYDDHVVSFDAAVLSVSQESERVKEDTEEELQQIGRKEEIFLHSSEIQEEPDAKSVKFASMNRIKADSSAIAFGHCSNYENGSTSEICTETKESAIRRETEGVFRLLGRREGNCGHRFFGVEENEQVLSMGRRVSFSMDDSKPTERSGHNLEIGEASSHNQGGDHEAISDGNDDAQEWGRREPEIICTHLDHVNMLGLNKTTIRLRYLVNWLVASLLQLRLPDSDGRSGVPLVNIYGPKIKYERGAAVAFHVKDSSGSLIHPEVVQKLAEKNDISLGIGFLSHIRVLENQKQLHGAVDLGEMSFCRPISNGRHDSKNTTIRVEVVTASLGFLTNFEDVYRMWAFVAKFLDPSFVASDRLSTVEESSET